LLHASLLHQYRRESRVVLDLAETLIALASEYAFQLGAWGTMLRGWALAMQGQEEEGATQMQQGLAAVTAGTASEGRVLPILLWAICGMIEVLGDMGRDQEGLELLTQAFAIGDKMGRYMWGAELYRLKGEFLLKRATPDASQAATCFHHALDIARRQHAKSLELRAAMSLSRLWQCHGQQQEAHQLLTLVYAWFIEGFDTADLQAAQSLLQALT
jgi:predicted ATPase